MTDERLGMAAGTMLRGIDRPPRDSQASVDVVMAEVRDTRQVRRWWPFGRNTQPTIPASGRSPARGSTMFSALKFVAAGVIVALFGGFLLSGILTTQQDGEVLPAAVTDAPSPMTTEELLSGMVTEEVEHGVYRVVNDGVRNPTLRVRGYPGATVDVTPDGGVWLSGDEGRQGVFRLGDERVFEDRVGLYREVAPDGSLWGIGDVSDSVSGIYSFDGEGWTLQATTTDDSLLSRALAVGPDGAVWLTALDFDKHCPDTESGDCFGTVLLRVEDDRSVTTVADWSEVYDGDVAYDEVVVSPDGDVWLIGTVRLDGPEAEALLRFDGEAWEVIPGPEGFLNHYAGRSMAFGDDGTLWVNTNHPEDDWQERGDWRVGGLARFDDPGWTIFTEADGVEDWGGQGFIATDLLSVAPDGSLWMNGIDDVSGCDGVDHYDGRTWTSYLRKVCVHDLALAPDGSVWVRADVEAGSWNATSYDVGLYVITPEAVTAREAAVADPHSTEALLAGMVTEEVEPGVFRVVNDGVRDLTPTHSDAVPQAVRVSPDGGVWLFGGFLDDAVFRLGEPGEYPWPEGADYWGPDVAADVADVEVGPDGTVWVLGDQPNGLAAFDGEAWTEWLPPDSPQSDGDRFMEVLSDGTVWATWGWRPSRDITRFDGERWTVVEPPCGPLWGMHASDHDIWWVSGLDDGCPSALYRYDGSRWQEQATPEGFIGLWPYHNRVGPDGTVWVSLRQPPEGWSGDEPIERRTGIARFDGTRWEEWGADDFPQDGIDPLGDSFWYQTVAPDGSLWATTDECDGLARFDGESLTRYLPGYCIFSPDAAPDGSLWLVAAAGSSIQDPTGLVSPYVITPEAVAAKE
jgi:hypothetical protein